MDCWIASFPRSGNTYFRNILYYVYGIESSTWHKESAYPVDEGYDTFRFVKTHLQPHELEPSDPSIPAIYLVRDGRDAVVSIAHHRSDLVMPGSDYMNNLKEAIVAAEGSFFGGWSENVKSWINRAQLIIKYEDLIADPKATFERVEALIPLPPPNWDNLPTFEQMKAGKPKYGGTSKLVDPKFDKEEFAGKFFRKGRKGSWKTEMPPDIQDLFWNYHGSMLETMGYDTIEGSIGQTPLLDFKAMQLLGMDVSIDHTQKRKVVIESAKLTQISGDGVKRYLIHLLKGFEELLNHGSPGWEFELLIGKRFLPLKRFRQIIKPDADELLNYEKGLMGIKKLIRFILPTVIYNKGATIYRNTDARVLLKRFQRKQSVEKELHLFHEFELKKMSVDLIHIPLPQNVTHLQSVQHKFVVTIHDLTHDSHPQFHEKQNTLLSEEGMRIVREKNIDVIAVSKNTAKDIQKLAHIPEEKIHLVYESADKELFRRNINEGLSKIIRTKYKIGDTPYFLCLSTIEPRKNLPNTIRAFNKLLSENPDLKVNLVISGSFGWKTEHLSRELYLDNPHIIFTGYVEDSDLNILYSDALALCYVSMYEGFGLPPLEAMSCRTPVIYGNNSSMTEVIGNCGLAAEPDNIDQIKDYMHKLATNSPFRDELAQQAYRHSFQFSHRKTIYETLKVYENLINKN